jgi:ParB-like chromosome segregation protein Spo0J
MEVAQALVMVPIRQIRPYHKNVRRNDATVERLVELIPKVGFNVPLVLDRRNVIVKGHSRWKAAVRLKMPELPCVYTDADEETIKLDRLADNRVQEFSAWDEENLALELNLIAPTFGPDLAALDFKIELPSRAPAAAPPPNGAAQTPHAEPPPDPAAEGLSAPPPPPEGYIEVVCNQCGTRLRVKQREA